MQDVLQIDVANVEIDDQPDGNTRKGGAPFSTVRFLEVGTQSPATV